MTKLNKMERGLLMTNMDYIHLIDQLSYCLSQIIQDLPERRDWLDPNLEHMARELIKKAR